MKIKHLWIPALIFGLIGGAAKIGDTVFNLNGDGFFLSSFACNTIFVASILIILIIGGIMNISDKNKSLTVSVKKDALCGIFGFIASVALIGTGVMQLLSIGSASSLASNFFMCLLNLFGGAVLLYESCIAFTGHNSMKNLPVLPLILPIWASGRFIALFIEYSKVSIKATEMFDIISVALLMLFLFYQAMFFAEISDTTALKKTSLYGTAFAICSLVTTADIIIKMMNPAVSSTGADVLVIEPTISRILFITADLALCFYAMFLIKDMNQAAVLTEEQDILQENTAQKEKQPILRTKITLDENQKETEENISAEEISELTVEPIVLEKEEEMPEIENILPEVKETVQQTASEPETIVEEVKTAEEKELVQEEIPEMISEPEPIAEPVVVPAKNKNVTPASPKKKITSEEADELDDIFKLIDEMSEN